MCIGGCVTVDVLLFTTNLSIIISNNNDSAVLYNFKDRQCLVIWNVIKLCKSFIQGCVKVICKGVFRIQIHYQTYKILCYHVKDLWRTVQALCSMLKMLHIFGCLNDWENLKCMVDIMRGKQSHWLISQGLLSDYFIIYVIKNFMCFLFFFVSDTISVCNFQCCYTSKHKELQSFKIRLASLHLR